MITRRLSLITSHIRRRARSTTADTMSTWMIRHAPMWWRRIREHGPEHWSIVVLDVAGFGRWRNRTQLQVRAVLCAAVRTAVRCTGLRWSGLAVEDRGDGMIILIPATVSKADILDPLIPTLAGIINEYNVTAVASLRIRLRVAVHAGEIHRDSTGWTGTDLNFACRLVDSPALYRCLQQTPSADLVLAVSDVIYHGIVQHAYRHISPATYTPFQVTMKEVSARAWLHTPNLTRAPQWAADGRQVHNGWHDRRR